MKGTRRGLTAPQAALSAQQLRAGFEVNRGQAHEEVRFLIRNDRHTLFLTRNEAVMTLPMPVIRGEQPEDQRLAKLETELQSRQSLEPLRMAVLRMRFLGANPKPRVASSQRLPGRINYSSGRSRGKSLNRIPTYGRIRYHDLYAGIELHLTMAGGHPRYEFHIAPRSDAGKIGLLFTGADDLNVDNNGALVIKTPAGEVRHTAPKIYQPLARVQSPIAGGFVIRGRQVGFRVGSYDRRKPLVIDPTIIFSQFVGGGDQSSTVGYVKLATGPDGSVYMSGITHLADLPEPHQSEYVAESDGFVAKFDLSTPTSDAPPCRSS